MSEDLVLTVNAGSSSLKLAAFALRGGAPACVLRIGIDRQRERAASVSGEPAFVQALALPVVGDDAGCVTALLAQLPVRAMAHRVVHGGNEPRDCISIDNFARARLHALAPLAPLHQPPALAIIDAVALARPTLPQFACLDTAFHATLPAVARDYALPVVIRARFPELRAYGFHGLSCRSTVAQLRARDALPARLVIAHLGSGASVTAVRAGRSIATSMGFSALDGLPMATRPGRTDPGVLLHLLRNDEFSVDELESLLYRQAGLLGMSGISGDLRVLQASEEPAARAAIDFFVYRVATEIAALGTALDGIDSIVFTGGVGEHQPAIRTRIITALAWLGARSDGTANLQDAFDIAAADSRIRLHVIACDEEGVMAAAVPRG